MVVFVSVPDMIGLSIYMSELRYLLLQIMKKQSIVLEISTVKSEMSAIEQITETLPAFCPAAATAHCLEC